MSDMTDEAAGRQIEYHLQLHFKDDHCEGGVADALRVAVRTLLAPSGCKVGHSFVPLDFTEFKSPCDLLPKTERVVESLYCTKCGATMKPVKP